MPGLVMRTPENDPNIQTFENHDSTRSGGALKKGNNAEKKRSEDTAVLAFLESEEMTPLSLTPSKVSHALRSAYLQLDQDTRPYLREGSTAVTTVFNGDTLVTAAIGDSSVFLAAYNEDKRLIHLERLNAVTHTVANPSEARRVKAMGMNIENGMITTGFYSLQITRAIGDNSRVFQNSIIAEPEITVTELAEIKRKLRIDSTVRIQWKIIACSDGFADALFQSSSALRNTQEKIVHERQFLRTLRECSGIEIDSDVDLARKLVEWSWERCASASRIDDISVVVSTITDKPCVIGVYDGHGGYSVADRVSQQIVGKIIEYLNTPELEQAMSSEAGPTTEQSSQARAFDSEEPQTTRSTQFFSRVPPKVVLSEELKKKSREIFLHYRKINGDITKIGEIRKMLEKNTPSELRNMREKFTADIDVFKQQSRFMLDTIGIYQSLIRILDEEIEGRKGKPITIVIWGKK